MGISAVASIVISPPCGQGALNRRGNVRHLYCVCVFEQKCLCVLVQRGVHVLMQGGVCILMMKCACVAA